MEQRAQRLRAVPAIAVRADFSNGHSPAARIGRGFFLDHATGVVIGATAVVEDDVSMLHGVTLGGSGTAAGERHPRCGMAC